MEMGTAMMKTTMKPASLMVGTAVDPMSIQIIALNVFALVKKDQLEEMEVYLLQPLLLFEDF